MPVAEMDFVLDFVWHAHDHHAPVKRFVFGADHLGPNLPMVFSQHFRLLASRDAKALRVDLPDAPVAVDQRETFGHGVKKVLVLVAFGTKLGLRAGAFCR